VLDGLSIAPRHVYYPVERTLALADVAAARRLSATRISWSVIWLKAYAAVCERLPLLRTVYQRWPWPQLVEADSVAGTLIVNRQDGEHERLCWAIFHSPQQQKLTELQTQLDRFQSLPQANRVHENALAIAAVVVVVAVELLGPETNAPLWDVHAIDARWPRGE
jgi:hypothetical protein